MTILTNLPVTLACTFPVTVTLDKDLLISSFGIVDPYWANPDHWVECRFIYATSAVGFSQKTKMIFSGNTAVLNLPVSSHNGAWLCNKILIWDGLEQQLVLDRASFPVATEFDFESEGGYPPLPPSFYQRDFNAPPSFLAQESHSVEVYIGGSNLYFGAYAGYPTYGNTAVAIPEIGKSYRLDLYVTSIVNFLPNNAFYSFNYGGATDNIATINFPDTNIPFVHSLYFNNVSNTIQNLTIDSNLYISANFYWLISKYELVELP